jgi:hypothetical protein
MATAIQYKSRVWTCSTHDEQIIDALLLGSEDLAKKIVASVHPKKGNSCTDCAYYYDLTPPSNR